MALQSEYDPSQSWPAFLVAAGILLIILFTLLAPEISQGLTGLTRILFWVAHVAVPLGVLQAVHIGLSRSARFLTLNPWLQTAMSGIAGSALFAPVALALDYAFGLAVSTGDQDMSYPVALLDEFAGLAPIVTLVWLGLNAARLLRLERPALPDPVAPPQSPAFWSRVPPKIGCDLVALSAELHYLRVRTAKGEALILYPFGAAVAELLPTGSGLQIHRSHWVSLGHVQRVERRGQGALCTLSSGLVLPVSRQYRAALLATFATAWGPGASLGA